MDLRGKKIVITGGCGQIGSLIVDALLAQSNPGQIVVIDNLTRGTELNLAPALADPRVKLVRADIRDRESLRACIDGAAVVFHQAAIRITKCADQPRECLEVLIDGTFNVLEASVAAGVRKVIAASSASVYGMADVFPTPESAAPYNNRTWYGAAKLANEAMLRSFHDMYGLNYVALRYFNVYGPRMDIFGKYTEVMIRWLDCLDRGERPKIFGDGLQTMDFIYNGDIARANLLALASDATDQVFNVASGQETSLRELLDVLVAVAGASNVEPEYLPARAVNPVPRRLADTTTAQRELGFRAEVSLEEGLRRLIDWRRQVIASGQYHAYVESTGA
jgi:UDP-glucose 4-epimerase